MKVKLELGEITEKQFNSPASQENTDKGTAIVTGGGAAAAAPAQGTDTKLKKDVGNGYWEGSVHWMLLGLPFLESKTVDGMFIVKDRQITFTDETGIIQPLKLNILTLATTCLNPEPCMAEMFVMQ